MDILEDWAAIRKVMILKLNFMNFFVVCQYNFFYPSP